VSAEAFEFATAGRVLFGAGRAAELPALLAACGSRALVCTGGRPDRHAGLLAGLGVPAVVFPVAGEPTVDLARAAAGAAREHDADVVVAIGGGSVIDTGKAAAMLLGNGGDPLDYLEVIGAGRAITRPSVPCVAVPTTAGTGAEVTANAVLASPVHKLKASLRGAPLLPRAALVDPLLAVSCPPGVTAASGMDALTQCLEPFVSPRASPLTDAVAREGIRRAASGLRRAYADGTDLAARSDMAVASLAGGMALANAKLGAVHGLAGVLGGTVAVPHGVACAALLAPVIEANVAALRATAPGHPALARYAAAAALLTGNPGAAIEDGAAWVRQTLALLGIPGLSAFGLTPAQFGAVAGQALRSSSMQGNPAALTAGDLAQILARAS
jgi:alcohol dehydrogenase class IV